MTAAQRVQHNNWNRARRRDVDQTQWSREELQTADLERDVLAVLTHFQLRLLPSCFSPRLDTC